MSEVKSVSDLYPPKWVRAEDLQGKAATVKVAAVTVETFYVPQIGQEKTAAVLAFEGKSRRLILNKTQCAALAQITSSERFADWIGHTVTLTPARTQAGKPTIRIGAAGE